MTQYDPGGTTDLARTDGDIGPGDELRSGGAAEADAIAVAELGVVGGSRRSRKLRPADEEPQSGVGTFIMAATILTLGAYLIVPTVILLVMSFNTSSSIFNPNAVWGFDNWINAWDHPALVESIRNSFIVWFGVAGISLPISIGIALLLARTNIPFSKGIEFGFWIAFIFPPLASTFGWMTMLDPSWGFLNAALGWLPFVEDSSLNIYTVPGIIFTRLMTDGIAYYVILLTPAFRNMNGALEEASRVSGYSNLKTMLHVTVPLMIAPITLVASLQLIKIFQGFEVEYILGSRIGFFVFSTLIYDLVRGQGIPDYATAIVLATITLVVVAIVIPIQHRITTRRTYTSLTSNYKPGLIDLRRWRLPAFFGVGFVLAMLTVVPAGVVVVGSFMNRVGFFDLPTTWTLDHWKFVFDDPRFMSALKTTVILSLSSGILSPLLFSVLAYMIVRTRWRGRAILDTVIWASAALPGILLGLGLLVMFLMTPGLNWLFGTIWPLIIVVVISGKTTGTNVFKGVLVQLGSELEEAGRTSGASWFRTYRSVVIPVLMPTMVLIGMLNFVGAANATSSVILLSSRNTETLSLLALEFGSGNLGRFEEALIISLIIMVMSLGLALPIRLLALRKSVRHDMHA